MSYTHCQSAYNTVNNTIIRINLELKQPCQIKRFEMKNEITTKTICSTMKQFMQSVVKLRINAEQLTEKKKNKSIQQSRGTLLGTQYWIT